MFLGLGVLIILLLYMRIIVYGYLLVDSEKEGKDEQVGLVWI